MAQVSDRDQHVVIPPKSGVSLVVGEGQRLRITDVEGAQVADLVCFDLHDDAHAFSQSRTRINNGRTRITVGDHLYSNKNEKMLAIVGDTVGVHDLLYPPCSSFLYETVFEVGPRNGCDENLASALSEHGFASTDVPDPFNVFMHTTLDDDHQMAIVLPRSRAGDHIELVAQIDLLVAVTACAEDISDCNAGNCTPIELRVVPDPG